MGRWYTKNDFEFKLRRDFTMNFVALTGHLGKDPETKDINGKTLAKFSLATRGYNDTTDWHYIECWGKTAELAAKYLHKGSMAGIVGAIRYNTQEKDGKKITYTSIIADKIEFLSTKQERQEVSQQVPISPADINLDDIPF